MQLPQPTSSPLPCSVFVYGTLMPGERNAGVAEEAGAPTEQEAATLKGYVLYDLRPEGYPGLVAGGGEVRGWLLHYAPEQWPAALASLDELEGLHLQPPLYSRHLASALTAGGEAKQVWVYLYARPERLKEPGAAQVSSGDWTDVAGRQTGTD